MPRDLFGDVTRPSVSVGTRKWYTVPVSLLTHSAIVFALVVIPLLATVAVPKPWQSVTVIFDVDSVPPPPPPPPDRPDKPAEDPPPNTPPTPTAAPTGFAPEPPEVIAEAPDERGPGFVPGIPFTPITTPPPPPDAAPPPPVRVGSGIRQPQKIRDIQPLYPQIAQAARVQGIVIIEATIGEDGQVINARILRSVPLLDQAAIDAVRQWQYTPTTLNGVPVPVIMSVTVQFTLSR